MSRAARIRTLGLSRVEIGLHILTGKRLPVWASPEAGSSDMETFLT